MAVRKLKKPGWLYSASPYGRTAIALHLGHRQSVDFDFDFFSDTPFLPDQDLIEALDQAPPGVFDPRSRTYWNLKLGRYLAPLMLRRRLD